MFLLLIFQALSSQGYEQAVIYGNSEILGYYYVDIWVGTPSVLQTVIIDTGSRLTAFPCIGCESCGKHMDPYFDYKKSNTSRIIQCNEGISCTSCNSDTCGYSQSYSEGSSISGMLVEDIVMFGDDFAKAQKVRAVFGCHRKETYLFRTQQADGIMGFAQKKNNILTLVDVLYKDNKIDSNVFSICFGKEDGIMSIGGYNNSWHKGNISWTGYYDESFYAVKMDKLKLNETKIEVKSSDFSSQYTTGTIIDSGTTFTYLSSKIYTALYKDFEKFCEEKGRCDGKTTDVYGEAHDCYMYDYEKYADIADFFATFPTIKLGIESIEVEWKAKYYLFAWPETPDIFCVGVYSNGAGGNVFGGNFMRGQNVIHDRDNRKIGFAESNCTPEYPHNKSRSTIPYYIGQKTDISVFSVVFYSCGIMTMASLSILYILKKRSKSIQMTEENQEV
ncbi:hypothetical protein SteCoe_30569 [Stentor coeruleus]|uniref:Peptidase A1 domain-containing protein n=1 Tax=Stentor coeruleus TaxID=5963 RepID=A0A1R2B3A9_9CILI|nr:hypothetical protein SteCoe_30569 [Stentor coeruleus]